MTTKPTEETWEADGPFVIGDGIKDLVAEFYPEAAAASARAQLGALAPQMYRMLCRLLAEAKPDEPGHVRIIVQHDVVREMEDLVARAVR